MDYNYIIEKVNKKTEFFIIKKFKEFKAEGRTFNYSVDKIRIFISDRNHNGIIGKNISLFESCHRFYNQHNSNFVKDTPISKTIDNEVKEEFIKVTEKKKPLDKNYKEVDNYNFNYFINDLIKYDLLRKVESRLSNNSELYKLYFESNNYTDFTLEKFEGHVINSELYQKLYSKFYPKKPVPCAEAQTDDFGNINYKVIENNQELDISSNKKILNHKIKKQTFELDEQLLILNICLEDKNSIPLTEKSKLIILIGEIIEDNIFETKSSNSLTYAKISKGIFRKGSTKTMIQIIDNIMTKLENHNLKMTKQTLNQHKITLKNEQNKV
ncbi:hypothetical protein OX283_014530 [Flavobacterium sp. SUN052]|uniref:hypothetical protein n=1 Tax=Flavobacterium sp. SUN052 TaxID=3002441 RepID=UPI00237DC3CF|nr:hypothetical protein [Flavobacterium sp. SUN052]MEC4005883.1 hypothetical protein [Flavobacterium sp. SUN052]